MAGDVIDVEAVRKQFPGLQHGLVCFNNAGGTAVYQGVTDSIEETMSAPPVELDLTDKRSLVKTQERIERFETLASFVNAASDEIAFGSSTTQLFRSLSLSLRPSLNVDSEIIVSTLCHEAGISAWIALAKSLQITIKWWTPPRENNATLCLTALKRLLSPKTRLVTCNHVSNILGTIHPIREIADLVHEIPGAMLCVDGVAWAPHRQIDVKALDVDFYCFSWYKVFGPHLAQIYAKRSVQARELTTLNHYFFNPRPLDTKIRLGVNCFELEHSVIPIIKYIESIGWHAIIAQEVVLQEALLCYLRSRPEAYTVYGELSSDPDKRVSLISFKVNGLSSADVADTIHNNTNFRVMYGNCYSVRAVHDVLGLPEDGILRVSLVHYNTVEEVMQFVKAMDELVLGHCIN